MKILFLLILTISLASCTDKSTLTQTNTELETVHTLNSEMSTDINISYLQFLPQDYDEKEEWPLLLFLHGAGERGSDIEKVAVHGPPKLARQGKMNDFIVVAPQCPTDDFWDSHEQQTQLIALLEQLKNDLKVDENKIYVTGLSMGGFGTWQLAATLKDEIAAAVPVCGGGNLWNARLLRSVPIWAFHGALDDVVPPKLTEDMVEAINARGGNAKMTIFPNANHNSWDPAYSTEELYPWLLSQSLENR